MQTYTLYVNEMLQMECHSNPFCPIDGPKICDKLKTILIETSIKSEKSAFLWNILSHDRTVLHYYLHYKYFQTKNKVYRIKSMCFFCLFFFSKKLLWSATLLWSNIEQIEWAHFRLILSFVVGLQSDDFNRYRLKPSIFTLFWCFDIYRISIRFPMPLNANKEIILTDGQN